MVRRKLKVAYVLGLGLALIPIHRLGMTIAMSGYVLILIALGTTLIRYRHRISLGPKQVYIPLLILLVLSVVSDSTVGAKAFALALFGVYLVGRTAGAKTFAPLGPIVVLGSVSIAAAYLFGDIAKVGGMYHATNYNIASAAIILGAVFCNHRYQWVLLSVVLIGMFFASAEEALVVVALLTAVVLIRRDLSKRTLLPVGILILVLIIATPLGITQELWNSVPKKVQAIAELTHILQTNQGEETVKEKLDEITNTRWQPYLKAIEDVRLLGHGYEPQNVASESIHNVPLRVLYELGPIGVLAWLWLLIYGLFKTQMKYAFVVILGLSLFDHLMWTQLPAYFWVVLGVGPTVIRSDLMFRDVKNGEKE